MGVCNSTKNNSEKLKTENDVKSTQNKIGPLKPMGSNDSIITAQHSHQTIYIFNDSLRQGIFKK